VQQEILRLIDDAGVVDVRAVSRRLPETDERDLTRALQILLGEGLIERQPPLSSQTQEKSALSGLGFCPIMSPSAHEVKCHA
jgi:hypothetical protein